MADSSLNIRAAVRDGTGFANRRMILQMSAAFLAGTVLLFALAAWLLYVRIDDQGRDEAERSARTMREHADKLVGGHLAFLDQIVWLIEDVGAFDDADKRAMHLRLRAIDEGRPEVQSVWVFEVDGDVIVSSDVYPAPATNFADRDYFRATAGGQETYIGEVVIGRVTGELNFNLARRLERPDGSFLGVLVVSLHPSAFTDFYASLADEGDVAMLVRDQGDVLALFPPQADDPVGLRVPPGLVGPQPRPDDPAAPHVAIDPAAYHFAERAVRNLPIRVLFGVPHASIRANWLSVVSRLALVAVPALLFLGALAALAYRKAGALDRSERELRALNRDLETRIADRTAALNEITRRQRLAATAAGLGVFEWDMATGAAHWENERMYEILGRRPEDGPMPLDGFLAGQVAEEDRAELRERLAAHPGEQAFSMLLRHRPPGADADRWIEITATTEAFPRVVGVISDATDRVRSEERRELLVRELDHRIRNTLAIVQSIAGQTFREGVPLPEARQVFRGRLAALASAHGRLSRGEGRSADLAEVVGDAIRSSGAPPDAVTAGGPPVTLGPDEAVAVAMTIHELATNAAKYGALSAEDGRVAIGWRVADRRLDLEWRETGGPAAAPSEGGGFGSRLIAALAEQHEGGFERTFAPDGLACTFSIRLRGT